MDIDNDYGFLAAILRSSVYPAISNPPKADEKSHTYKGNAMKYAEAKQGRIFIIRLEDGDVIHQEIERFARDQSIKAAAMIILGGADYNSKLIVGPKHGRKTPIHPMEVVLENVHEIVGTGTVFPNDKGEPILHMHIACGRETSTITGCVRKGVKAWHILEVILIEFLDTNAFRVLDPVHGLTVLKP